MADEMYNIDSLISFMNTQLKKNDSVSIDDMSSSGMDNIIEHAKGSKPIQDAYRNVLTATGTADITDKFSSYGFSNDSLNWPLWLTLYNDSWVFKNGIDRVARDMVNSGFTITPKKGESYDTATIYADFTNYKQKIIELVQWGRLFGGAVGIMMFDKIPLEEMDKPPTIDKIKSSSMQITVTDRWYGCSPSTELVTSMKSFDYGLPKSYDITFPSGVRKTIHHSYILRFENRTAPPLIKSGMLQGWGYAEGAHVFAELSRDDKLKSEISSLINKCNIEIIKMSGMRGVFMGTDTSNEIQLRKRLEQVTWGRNYNSLTFLDKDDEYQHFEFAGISGLSSLLETNMWIVAAAFDMSGILFGNLRGGLSQESDDYKRYADQIKYKCEGLRMFYGKLLTVIAIKNNVFVEGEFNANGNPKIPNISYNFDSLVKLDDQDKKIEIFNNALRALSDLVNIGVYSKYDLAKSINALVNNNSFEVVITEDIMNYLKNDKDNFINNPNANNNKINEILKSQFPDKLNNTVQEAEQNINQESINNENQNSVVSNEPNQNGEINNGKETTT